MAEPGSRQGIEPGSGRIEGGLHRLPVRVYYEDTDAGGIVYHANYLRWAERARTEMMRLLGAEHSRMVADEGAMFAVRRCALEFDRPARLDDVLEVRTRVVGVGGATLELEQVVVASGEGGSRGVRGGGPVDAIAGIGDKRGASPGSGAQVRISLTLCCLNRGGRPVRLPASVGEALRALASRADGGRD
jgi:acyl-CoA thioester hydrolase